MSFRRDRVAVALSCALGAVVIGASGAALLSTLSTRTLLLAVLAVVVVAALAVLALARFDWALLLAIGLRISLDGLKAFGGGRLAPGTAVGGLFILLAVPYLAGRALGGTYRPASSATKGLYCLSLAAAVSAVTSAHSATAAVSAAQVLSGTLMFAVLEQELHENRQMLRRVLLAVCLSTAVPFAVGLVQVVTVTGNTEITPGYNRIYGTAAHPTPFATYLVIVLLAAVAYAGARPRFRVPLYLLFSVGAFLLVNTFTRGAWAAVVVGLVYLTGRFRGRLLGPLIVVVVAAFLFLPQAAGRLQGVVGAGATSQSSSLVWRFGYWGEIAPLAANNPVTGIGLGATALETPQGANPHDIFIQTYVELGGLGVVALLAVIWGFWTTFRHRRQAAATGEERALATLSIAIGLAIAVEGLSSNVLTQAMLYWYFAAACAFGFVDQAEPQGDSTRDRTDGSRVQARRGRSRAQSHGVLGPRA